MCYKTAHHPHYHHWKRHHAKRRAKGRFAPWGFPPVNVEELDDHYEVLLFAAGYSKSDFQISVADNTLIIAAKRPEATDTTTDWTNWKRQEFKPRNFERYFELNDKIDKEAISAKYEDGVLRVTLPKLSGFETVRQDIEVN